MAARDHGYRDRPQPCPGHGTIVPNMDSAQRAGNRRQPLKHRFDRYRNRLIYTTDALIAQNDGT